MKSVELKLKLIFVGLSVISYVFYWESNTQKFSRGCTFKKNDESHGDYKELSHYLPN